MVNVLGWSMVYHRLFSGYMSLYMAQKTHMHGQNVCEVDGLTEAAFGAEELADEAHGTIDKGQEALLENRRRQSSIA